MDTSLYAQYVDNQSNYSRDLPIVSMAGFLPNSMNGVVTLESSVLDQATNDGAGAIAAIGPNSTGIV